MTPLSVGQVQALLAALLPAYRVAGLLGAGCGLRVGEVLGLTVDSIDLDRALVQVNVQLQAAPGQRPRLVAPKSQASIRSVPLPDSVAVGIGIEQHLASCPVLVSAGLDGLLIRNSRGGPMWPRTSPASGDARRRLPGVRFHVLRHFYASALIAAGESVTTVQAALGHASAVETLEVYAGLWPDRDPAMRAAIDQLLAPEAEPDERSD